MPVALAPSPTALTGINGLPVPIPRPFGATIGSVLRLSVAGFLGFLVFGNLFIVAASAWARESAPAHAAAPAVTGVGNFRAVDDAVWRGGAPSVDGYRSLAAAGARTVVDLRAEDDLDVDTDLLGSLGLRYVPIPMRDGQTPSESEVDAFLAAVRDSDGPTFVHCGAGVGRTGTMVAAYLVTSGQNDGLGSLRANLSVGPPSLEQIAYAAGLEPGNYDRPAPMLVAVSRVLDAPRRFWARLSH